MRVVDLICPGCGAPLSINGQREYIFCSYCGKQIYIENKASSERKDAFDSFQQHTPHGPNMELAGKLRKARDILAQREELIQQIEEAQNTLLTSKNEKLGMSGILIGVIVVSAILLIINGGLAILGICLGIIVLIIVYKNKKQKKAEIIAEMQNRIDVLIAQKEKHAQKSLGINLNEKYLTSGALNKLYEFVVNERAYTLQQALNLFEERAQHLKMEKLARDQLDAQRRQIELLEQHNSRLESRQMESDDNGFTLDKAILVGGLAMQAIRFFRKK